MHRFSLFIPVLVTVCLTTVSSARAAVPTDAEVVPLPEIMSTPLEASDADALSRDGDAEAPEDGTAPTELLDEATAEAEATGASAAYGEVRTLWCLSSTSVDCWFLSGNLEASVSNTALNKERTPCMFTYTGPFGDTKTCSGKWMLAPKGIFD